MARNLRSVGDIMAAVDIMTQSRPATVHAEPTGRR
jgi:hypothetical protein